MGNELKLRQLAKPLDEARKNPKVDKAVLFVESLFGGKLKSEPDIIQVNDENKLKFLRLVREDFPANKINHFFTKSLKSKELIEEYNELKKEYGIRRTLEMIGRKEEKQNFETKIDNVIGAPDGGYIIEHNIVVGREGDGTSVTLVHELIHAEDNFILDQENPMFTLVKEGRARFGETIFDWGNDWDTEAYVFGIEDATFQGIRDNFWNKLKSHGPRYLLKCIQFAIENFTIHREKLYTPFERALAFLTSEVGDPYLAFRITTEKQPRTKDELKNFKEFYKEEIEKYRKQN